MSSIQMDHPWRAANAHTASASVKFFSSLSNCNVDTLSGTEATDGEAPEDDGKPTKLCSAKRLGTRIPWTRARQTYPISECFSGNRWALHQPLFTLGRGIQRGIHSTPGLPSSWATGFNSCVVMGVAVGQQWRSRVHKKVPTSLDVFVSIVRSPSWPLARSGLPGLSLRRQPSPTKVERGVAFQEGIGSLGRPSIKPLTAW